MLKPEENQKRQSESKDRDEASKKEEMRRLMYERIAQGNALAEVEEKARHQWGYDG